MKENRLKLVARYLVLIAGLLIMGMSVAMAKVADLGMSPISSIPNVLSFIFLLPIGQITIIFLAALILLEWVVLRSKFRLRNILEMLPSLVFGYGTDFFVGIFEKFPHSVYWQQFILMLISIVLLAIGVYLEVVSNVIVMPGEGIILALSYRLKKEFPKVKVWGDASMVVIALLISLLYFGNVTGIREGTILTAIFTGRIIAIIQQRMRKFSTWLNAENK
ncbi:MAG: YitT family protein [Lactococcus sp.]